MFIQKKIFNKNECSEILKLIDENNRGYSYTNTKGALSLEQYKIYDNNDNSWFLNIFKNFVYESTRYKVNDIKIDVQILKYKLNDNFPKHTDIEGLKNTNEKRLFTIGVLLNDEFEGGDLIVYEDGEKKYLKKEIGNCYIFDAVLPHEVTHITNGLRYVLVAHIRNIEVQKKFM